MRNKFHYYRIYCYFELLPSLGSSTHPNTSSHINLSNIARMILHQGLKCKFSCYWNIDVFFHLISLIAICDNFPGKEKNPKRVSTYKEIYFLWKFNASCHYNETIHWDFPFFPLFLEVIWSCLDEFYERIFRSHCEKILFKYCRHVGRFKFNGTWESL